MAQSSILRAWLWLSIIRWARCQTIHTELEGTTDGFRCTIDDLLPGGDTNKFRSGWTDRMVDSLPYDCSCATFKARYFCPSLEEKTYPMWEHPAVTEGNCSVVQRDKLAKEPLPPGSKVLLYGNSYLRQVMQGLMCMFPDALESRRVTIYPWTSTASPDMMVGSEVQCRACYGDEVTGAILTENSCISKELKDEGCRCKDDTGEFNFKNGAKLHYYFANHEEDKCIDHALEPHGTSFSDYDMVFANPGNLPSMDPASVLSSARSMNEAGVTLVWMSSYQGLGIPEEYFGEGDQLEHFRRLGIRFLPVHDIVKAVTRFEKGQVEGGSDSHFCLPGPTNELSLFFAQVIWSALVGQ